LWFSPSSSSFIDNNNKEFGDSLSFQTFDENLKITVRKVIINYYNYYNSDYYF
jgi:hypothetical protein